MKALKPPDLSLADPERSHNVTINSALKTIDKYRGTQRLSVSVPYRVTRPAHRARRPVLGRRLGQRSRLSLSAKTALRSVEELFIPNGGRFHLRAPAGPGEPVSRPRTGRRPRRAWRLRRSRWPATCGGA